MSGLVLAAQPGVGVERSAEALRFTPATACALFETDGVQGAVTRVDAMDLWGPAHDPATGVRVALGGRVALERAVWDAARALPYSGGLACRAILAAWLERGERIVVELNGAFCVVILDPRRRELHLVTDRMGIYPIYRFEGPDGLRLSSHPDVLADLLEEEGRTCEIDWTTVAECLGTCRSVHPYTYYRNIRQLNAGTHYLWHTADPAEPPRVREYWYPSYRAAEPPSDWGSSFVEEFAHTLMDAVRKRTHPHLGRSAVLLSGGADSRSILYSLADPASALGITYCDVENAEVATARRLARVAGAQHLVLQRSADHYADSLADTVRISGGMWSAMSGHHAGFAGRIHQLGPGVLMTGCYADYLFKGIAICSDHNTLFGRPLPLKKLSCLTGAFHFPQHTLRDSWSDKVACRLAREIAPAVRHGYTTRTALLVEERRLRPLIREADASGRLTLIRCLPTDWPFADTGVLAMYGRLSVEMKLNGIVFERAVRRVCGPRAAAIRNNNYCTRMGAGELGRAAGFLRASLARKVRKSLGISDVGLQTGLATAGSWPNWAFYIGHSEGIRALWSQPTHSERELFTDMIGFDPWLRTTQEWATETHFFMNILTVRLWLKQRRLM